MTIDKNKRLNKGSNTGKKRAGDGINKKEWINLKSPSFFGNKTIGSVLVNKIPNLTVSQSSNNQNKICILSLADLTKNEDLGFKKIKMKCMDFKEGSCSTIFYGLELTRDKLCSMLRKWQTLIETHIDVKTKDGSIVRVFIIAFSKRRKKQIKKTSYLNSAQIRSIRRKILEVLLKETNEILMKDLIGKILSEKINQDIENECNKIFPLYNIFIRKVKVLNDNKV